MSLSLVTLCRLVSVTCRLSCVGCPVPVAHGLLSPGISVVSGSMTAMPRGLGGRADGRAGVG